MPPAAPPAGANEKLGVAAEAVPNRPPPDAPPKPGVGLVGCPPPNNPPPVVGVAPKAGVEAPLKLNPGVEAGF